MVTVVNLQIIVEEGQCGKTEHVAGQNRPTVRSALAQKIKKKYQPLS